MQTVKTVLSCLIFAWSGSLSIPSLRATGLAEFPLYVRNGLLGNCFVSVGKEKFVFATRREAVFRIFCGVTADERE